MTTTMKNAVQYSQAVKNPVTKNNYSKANIQKCSTQINFQSTLLPSVIKLHWICFACHLLVAGYLRGLLFNLPPKC
jgi:hypothetical protein